MLRPLSPLLSGYYLFFANEADEKVRKVGGPPHRSPVQSYGIALTSILAILASLSQLRKFRAFCTVEMLRATWEKTGSPLVRAATYRSRPKIQLKKKIVLPRPQGSPYRYAGRLSTV